jgi:hypothetical protein
MFIIFSRPHRRKRDQYRFLQLSSTNFSAGTSKTFNGLLRLLPPQMEKARRGGLLINFHHMAFSIASPKVFSTLIRA